MLDIAIKGGTVVSELGSFVADVGIEGDKIAIVARNGRLPTARREIQANGKLVLPGVIDIHFHVRAPLIPTGAPLRPKPRAAAAGGVTTILEMPISTPGCPRRDILKRARHSVFPRLM